jgi:hypothetical protein
MALPDASSFLLHGEERFGVLGDLLAFASPVFSAFRHANPTLPYPISSKTASDSIRAFIDACHQPLHNRPPDITWENAFDLSDLCDEFQTPVLQAQVHAFINANALRMIIPAIHRRFEAGLETMDLEMQLRNQLTEFLTDPELATLPLPCLARVVASNEKVDFNQIFDYCLGLLDKRGPSASVLFRGLNLALCSAPQICALKDHPHFLWAFVADSLSSTLVSLLNTSVKYRKFFEDEHAEVERLRAERLEFMEALDTLSTRVSSVEQTIPELVRESERREMAQTVDTLSARVSSVEQTIPEFVKQSDFAHFPLKPGPPPEGIIAYLTHKCGRNPAQAGLVAVMLSSNCSTDRLGPNALDFMTATDACAGVTHTESQWIAFDFRGMRVVPTHYWIRSYSSGVNGAHLKSWVFESVDTQGSAIPLHTCTNCQGMNGPHKIGWWTTDRTIECRILRLRSTGETHCSGNWRVIISGFEVFGQLRE